MRTTQGTLAAALFTRSGAAEVGLIIHEGQLTYAASGLQKVLDLGQWWH